MGGRESGWRVRLGGMGGVTLSVSTRCSTMTVVRGGVALKTAVACTQWQVTCAGIPSPARAPPTTAMSHRTSHDWKVIPSRARFPAKPPRLLLAWVEYCKGEPPTTVSESKETERPARNAYPPDLAYEWTQEPCEHQHAHVWPSLGCGYTIGSTPSSPDIARPNRRASSRPSRPLPVRAPIRAGRDGERLPGP
jgi:hypothetical protein